jgi:hypothetical protein
LRDVVKAHVGKNTHIKNKHIAYNDNYVNYINIDNR